MSKIKNITLGIIIGLSIASTHTFAQDIKQYILNKVNYPIIVNNVEYNNEELPILNLNGSTYVPLRAVGDILDAKVEWNDELKRVEIGEVEVVNEPNKKTTNFQDGYMQPRELNDLHPNYLLQWSDRDRKTMAMYIKINDGESSQMLIDNIEYTIDNVRIYISKETYEKDLLPLINN